MTNDENKLKEAYGERFSQIKLEGDNVQRTDRTVEGDLSILRPRTMNEQTEEVRETEEVEEPKRKTRKRKQ